MKNNNSKNSEIINEVNKLEEKRINETQKVRKIKNSKKEKIKKCDLKKSLTDCIIKYPQKLNEKDIIGITAPSSAANILKIDYAIENIKKLGYNVAETKSVRNENVVNTYVSADAEIRADEFINLFNNKEIKHILCASGGEFAIDMVMELDKQKERLNISDNIKYVQGFSDNSLLLYYLTTNYYIATLHFVNLGDYAMKNLYKNLKSANEFLTNDKALFEQYKFIRCQRTFEMKQIDYRIMSYDLMKPVKYKLINIDKMPVTFEGRMLGGCIDVLTQIIGTKLDKTKEFVEKFKDDGIIWYIDNFGLDTLELYRRLRQMENAGWFKNVNAFLIGRTLGKQVIDFSLDKCLKLSIGKLNKPIIYNVDIGHLPPQYAIINGSKAKCRYNKGNFSIIQELK